MLAQTHESRQAAAQIEKPRRRRTVKIALQKVVSVDFLPTAKRDWFKISKTPRKAMFSGRVSRGLGEKKLASCANDSLAARSCPIFIFHLPGTYLAKKVALLLLLSSSFACGFQTSAFSFAKGCPGPKVELRAWGDVITSSNGTASFTLFAACVKCHLL